MRKLIFFMIFCWCAFPLIPFADETPVKGGTLIWGRLGDPDKLDLAQSRMLEAAQSAGQVTEGLLCFAPNSLEIRPALATSWKVSDDGLIWRFNLRQGVRFHNGEPFTAQDVKDSVERVINKDHPFYGYGKWSIAATLLSSIKEVKINDDHTVDIITKQPYAALVNNLATPLIPILSSKVMAKLKDQVANMPIGTGPFRFVRWRKDTEFVVERFDDYWGQKAYVDRVIIKPIPDASARLMALQSGTIDIADSLDPDSIALVKKDSNLNVLEQTSCGITYLVLNCQKPYLKEVLVRRAINYAIDKLAMIKSIFQGMAVPAKNPYPPTAAFGYNDDIMPYEYNPAKAKELLKQAGIEKGAKLSLMVMNASQPYMPEPQKAAELIQAYLAAVGIEVNLVRFEPGTYFEKMVAGEHDMCILGWMLGTGHPDSFMFTLLSGVFPRQPARWFDKFNDEYTKLVGKARTIFDQKESSKLYREAQEIFHDQAPWVPLAYPMVVRCTNKRVHNVPLSPTSQNRMDIVWKEK